MEVHYSSFRIASVVALYWCVSIVLVFINKHILSGSLNDLSLFVTWFQSVVAVTLIQVLHYLSRNRYLNLKVPDLDFSVLLNSQVLKLSFSFVISLIFNNLMLKHIGISFYQVARSCTLIFTILLSLCVLKKKVSLIGTIACALVISGFVTGIDQEDSQGTLSMWGILYGLFASLSTAVCGIYFKQAEPILEHDSLKTAYYNNFNCCWFLLPLIISSGQANQVFQEDFSASFSFWFYLTISGFLSLSIGWVSALQIKYTSPVTHHISINAKSVTQTLIAILYYGDSKTSMWWVGNFLVILGVTMYATGKSSENKSDNQKLPLKK